MYRARDDIVAMSLFVATVVVCSATALGCFLMADAAATPNAAAAAAGSGSKSGGPANDKPSVLDQDRIPPLQIARKDRRYTLYSHSMSRYHYYCCCYYY